MNSNRKQLVSVFQYFRPHLRITPTTGTRTTEPGNPLSRWLLHIHKWHLGKDRWKMQLHTYTWPLQLKGLSIVKFLITQLIATDKSEHPQPFMIQSQKSQSVISAIFSWFQTTQAHPDTRTVGVDPTYQWENCQIINLNCHRNALQEVPDIFFTKRNSRFHLSDPSEIK